MIDRGSTPDLLTSTLKGLNEDAHRWWKRIKSEKLIGTGISQIAAGGMAFIATLAAGQALQGGLRISAATPLGIPVAIGSATVATGGILALRCADAVNLATNIRGDFEVKRDIFVGEVTRSPSLRDLGAGTLSMSLFLGFGGHFAGIAPSALDSVGAFSKPRVALRASLEYATSDERAVINHLGSIFGCHSCGIKKRVGGGMVTYISDHVPPVKYVKVANSKLWRRLTGLKVAQQFLPQCQSCSQAQSTAVRTGHRVLKYHFSALGSRSEHGTGAAIALANVCLGNGKPKKQ
eukprot:21525_1